MIDGLTSINDEEPDPFENFDTLAEVCAFIYKRDGEAFLRQAMTQSGTSTGHEVLEMAADELKAIGLRKVAKIMSEFAANCLPWDDLSLCPYPLNEANRHNIESWLRTRRQQQRRWKRKRKS